MVLGMDTWFPIVFQLAVLILGPIGIVWVLSTSKKDMSDICGPRHIEAGIRKKRKQITSDDEEYEDIQKEEIEILKKYIK